MVQLNDELITMLDREAARRGLSRSAVIRGALEDFLRNDRESQLGEQIIEGYKRIPPETPDEWGDLSKMTDQATVHLLQRLDSEERRQGHKPW